MGTIKKVGDLFYAKVDTDRDFFNVVNGWRCRHVRERDGLVTEILDPFVEIVSSTDQLGAHVTVTGGDYTLTDTIYVAESNVVRTSMIMIDPLDNKYVVSTSTEQEVKELTLNSSIVTPVTGGDVISEVVSKFTLASVAQTGDSLLSVEDASSVAVGDVYEQNDNSYTVQSVDKGNNTVTISPNIAGGPLAIGTDFFLKSINLVIKDTYVAGDTIIKVKDLDWAVTGMKVKDTGDNEYTIESINISTKKITITPGLVSAKAEGDTLTRVPGSYHTRFSASIGADYINLDETIELVVPGMLMIDDVTPTNTYTVESINYSTRTIYFTSPLVQSYAVGSNFQIAALVMEIDKRDYALGSAELLVLDASSIQVGMQLRSETSHVYTVDSVNKTINKIFLTSGLTETIVVNDTFIFDYVITSPLVGGTYTSGSIMYVLPDSFKMNSEVRTPIGTIYTVTNIIEKTIGKIVFVTTLLPGTTFTPATELSQGGVELTLAEEAQLEANVIKVTDAGGVLKGTVYLDVVDMYHYITKVDLTKTPNELTIKTRLKKVIPNSSKINQVGNTGVYKVPITIVEPGDYTIIVSNPEIMMQNIAFSVQIVTEDVEDLHKRLRDILDMLGYGIDDQIRFYKGFV